MESISEEDQAKKLEAILMDKNLALRLTREKSVEEMRKKLGACHPMGDLPVLRRKNSTALLFVAFMKHGHEGLLRYVNRANGFHPLLTFFLLRPQFALSRNVTAVAFGRYIFA